MRMLLAIVAPILLLPAAADASPQDFSFLVQQRVMTMECPGYGVDVFAIEDAIFEEGKRLGWSRPQILREMEGRRVHQVAKHQANPSDYCQIGTELEAANKHRLRSLGVRP